ncbi:MAG: hypothetical protein K0R36_536 [Chryseobacterium sp.]|jgi:hypothetical protein|nr:hypothetical protein [Chryseobacterium sp.]
MFHNGNKYDKVFHNGNLYNKAYQNGNLILGSNTPVDPNLILDIPFQNSISNISPNGLAMVAASTSPVFVAGRKGTDYCAYFNGTRSIKTNGDLNLNSNKVTMSVWYKPANLVGKQILCELSDNSDSRNAFNNYSISNVFYCNDNLTTGTSRLVYSSSLVVGTWVHIVAVIERGVSARIYINGVLASSTGDNLTGNFGAFPIFIGMRGGTTLGLIGYMQELKLYNKALTQAEITSLYNL